MTVEALQFDKLPHFEKPISSLFHRETVENGLSASEFFEQIGLRYFATQHQGICTFTLDNKLAIYQVNNVPLVKDELLSPSTGPNKALFGEFMGTLDSEDPARKEKRRAVIKKLGNLRHLAMLIPDVKSLAKDAISSSINSTLSLETVAMEAVAHVDSYLPGIIDLCIKPLTSYLRSDKYSEIMRYFFEHASDVISKMDNNALSVVRSITPVIQDIISENFESIEQADSDNIIKAYFTMANIPFTRERIDNLPADFLKELGTILIAIYDTTSLSLYWLICYIENDPNIKRSIIDESDSAKEFSFDRMSYIELAILESIRLAGNNPTALWRELLENVEVTINENQIRIPAGTMLWLDRRAANQDTNVFPKAKQFCPMNIETIRANGENSCALLVHNRYEINSFSMINTINNPRKCPGRFFSVMIQSCLIREIYRHYHVECNDISTGLRRHCSMPRPDNNATIKLTAK